MRAENREHMINHSSISLSYPESIVKQNIMEISKNNGLCGFQPYEFRSLLEGNTLVTGYTYKNRKIKDLLISDGEDYIYEDDDVILYTPTEITEDALFRLSLKKVPDL